MECLEYSVADWSANCRLVVEEARRSNEFHRRASLEWCMPIDRHFVVDRSVDCYCTYAKERVEGLSKLLLA